MIKLQKGAEPQILTDNCQAWEDVLHAHDANATKPTKSDLNRYNNPETKDALMQETSEKCAYCESKFKHISYGDIEHIVPKRLGHQWRFRWSNLTIACTTCNTGKGTLENLIDPYVDDPEQEFDFFGPALVPRPESPKAIATESALELNRTLLIKRRAERLQSIHRLLMIAKLQKDAEHMKILLDEIRIKETRDSAEFAAMIRSFVKDLIAKGHMPSAE